MKKFLPLISILLISCGLGNSTSLTTPAPSGPTATGAADFRSQLDTNLGEAQMLMAKATAANLDGRKGEFTAYSNLLNTNTSNLANLFGQEFVPLWTQRNSSLIDYCNALALNDNNAKQAALNDITNKYIQPITQFFVAQTGLDANTINPLVTGDISQTTQIIDAQANKNWTSAYTNIRTAYASMFKLGNTLAPGIIGKSTKFPGDANSKAVTIRLSWDQLLQEHAYLSSFASSAIVRGNNDESTAAQGAISSNATDMTSLIGSLSSLNQDQFTSIWNSHNGYLTDYANGVAAKDTNKKQQAVNDLTQKYIPQFAQLFSKMTNLSTSNLSQSATLSVTNLTAVTDAQGNKDQALTANSDLVAGKQAINMADSLAAGFVAHNPQLLT